MRSLLPWRHDVGGEEVRRKVPAARVKTRTRNQPERTQQGEEQIAALAHAVAVVALLTMMARQA